MFEKIKFPWNKIEKITDVRINGLTPPAGATVKTYDDDPVRLSTVDKNDVEIFRVGTWNGDVYSRADLQAMVDAFDKVGFNPAIKCGHEPGQEKPGMMQRLFGEPSLGIVKSIYLKGDSLYANLADIPRRFGNLIQANAYRRISSEIYWDYACESSGKKFPRVLKAIAFLGAKIPALTSLKAIESLYHQRGGRLFAYDESGHEFRLYNSDEYPAGDGCKVEKHGDKWCVMDDGKEVGCHDDEGKAKAQLAQVKASKQKSMSQKSETVKTSEGEDMDIKEFEAKLAEMKTEMAKEYEAKMAEQLATFKADQDKTYATAKADAEKELKEKMDAQAAQVKKLETERRSERIAGRIEKLKTEGKVPKAWESRLTAVFEYLPEEAAHTYSNEGKEVKESVAETLWKLFEDSPKWILKQFTTQDDLNNRPDHSDDPEIELNNLAKKHMKESGEKDLAKALAYVAKENPDLYREYNEKVTGSRVH